jgi:hypothetical protein
MNTAVKTLGRSHIIHNTLRNASQAQSVVIGSLFLRKPCSPVFNIEARNPRFEPAILTEVSASFIERQLEQGYWSNSPV